MVFINYRIIAALGIFVGLLSMGVMGYRSLRSIRNSLIRQSLRFAADGVASLSLFPLLFVGCSYLAISSSEPLLSADHRYAVRVTDFDAGAVGGDTAVEIFTDHGFRSGAILQGGWKIVEAQDVHWPTNSELLIEYPADTGYDPPACHNFDNVKVTCRPTDRHTWNHN